MHDEHNGDVVYYLSKGLIGSELQYSHVEKLSMAVVFIRLLSLPWRIPWDTLFSCQVIGLKYSKWIFILKKFNLVFTTTKVKISLVFAELLLYLPRFDLNEVAHDPMPDEYVYLVKSTDPWYKSIIFYLQTQHFHSNLSLDNHRHIRHHNKHYLVLNDIWYHHGVDSILQCCITLAESEQDLNDCHARACGITFQAWILPSKYCM